MASHYVMILSVTDKHRLKPKAFRPDPAEWADAAAALPDGRTMESFLRACLRRLSREPEAFAEHLAPDWPPEKPKGRPRKTT